MRAHWCKVRATLADLSTRVEFALTGKFSMIHGVPFQKINFRVQSLRLASGVTLVFMSPLLFLLSIRIILKTRMYEDTEFLSN